MPKKIDVIGQRFGRLTVLNDAEASKGRRRVSCVCVCGESVICDPRLLRLGQTKSCGCLQRDSVAEACRARATHGLTCSPEYQTWIHMKGRCNNPSDRKFKHYGARGIRVCRKWIESFEQFLVDMGPKPHANASIDRIDVNGDYEPGNCRWATPLMQSRNKRNHRLVELNGEMVPLSQACESKGINYRSALYRLNTGANWMPLPHPPVHEGGGT